MSIYEFRFIFSDLFFLSFVDLSNAISSPRACAAANFTAIPKTALHRNERATLATSTGTAR